jgi:hypothetical protein
MGRRMLVMDMGGFNYGIFEVTITKFSGGIEERSLTL